MTRSDIETYNGTDTPIIPVLLCGGTGKRLYPLSQNHKPKQFLPLLDKKETMLQMTAKRAMEAVRVQPNHLVTITLGRYKEMAASQLSAIHPALTDHILCEPIGKNTAAAIAYATLYVKETFGENSILWVMPTDHAIGDSKSFRHTIEDAVRTAKCGHISLLGIEPTHPETGYGYIKTGRILAGTNVRKVATFTEKPDAATAQHYLESGEYLWNSGMFIMCTRTALKNFKTYSPETFNHTAQAFQADPKSPSLSHYTRIEPQSFDIAVLERSADTAVIPCDAAWSDVGSWRNLIRAQARTARATL